MVEALLSGIILGLVPVSIGGLFTTAYLQYRRAFLKRKVRAAQSIVLLNKKVSNEQKVPQKGKLPHYTVMWKR